MLRPRQSFRCPTWTAAPSSVGPACRTTTPAAPWPWDAGKRCKEPGGQLSDAAGCTAVEDENGSWTCCIGAAAGAAAGTSTEPVGAKLRTGEAPCGAPAAGTQEFDLVPACGELCREAAPRGATGMVSEAGVYEPVLCWPPQAQPVLADTGDRERREQPLVGLTTPSCCGCCGSCGSCGRCGCCGGCGSCSCCGCCVDGCGDGCGEGCGDGWGRSCGGALPWLVWGGVCGAKHV
mmetsp:Transcript_24422/g.70646  ORF Transcript_24422/g.70646 Transcript_24422/m.70646 type:complete len:234 (+) Transcript_24422:38-739(+)